MMNKVYIGVGSNLGDSFSLIEEAYTQIEEQIGQILKRSSLYETRPWGFEAPSNFVNSVILVQTDLPALSIMNGLLKIEQQLGRTRDEQSAGYSSRKIDLDVLAIDDQIIKEKSLIVPHPKMHLRAFVLVPLREIAPAWQHPTENQNIDELIQNLDEDELSNPRIIEK